MQVGARKVSGEVTCAITVADAKGGSRTGVGNSAGAIEDIDGVGAGGHRAHADSIEVKGGTLTDNEVDVGGPKHPAAEPKSTFVDADSAGPGDGIGGVQHEHAISALGEAGGAGDERGVDREGVTRPFYADGEIVAGRRRNERSSAADGAAASGEQDAGAGRGADGQRLARGEREIVGAIDLEGVDRSVGLGGDGTRDTIMRRRGECRSTSRSVYEANVGAIRGRTQRGADT